MGFQASRGSGQFFPGFEPAQACTEQLAGMLNLAVWKYFLRNQMPMPWPLETARSFDEPNETKWTHNHPLQMKVYRTVLP
jgi:hypothetical protein